jgi:hypothetical protein
VASMGDAETTGPDATADMEWPTHCDVCGTRLVSAVVDFDQSNADRPELRPGEMAAVDYCPNPDCPTHATAAPETGPGSLGGDNGGG